MADVAETERIEELASLGEVRTLLREQLQLLESGQREALWLRVVEEQLYATVAARLGISEQAARARVSRALRALSEPLAAAELGSATTASPAMRLAVAASRSRLDRRADGCA